MSILNSKRTWLITGGATALLLLAFLVWQAREKQTISSQQSSRSEGFTGSQSCRPCHEKFHQLWSSSRHGSTMQPFTPELAQNKLIPQTSDVVIGAQGYCVEIENGAGWMRETGAASEKKYRIFHALGGKNVYYFLIPMDRGRLQVAPLAYDVHKQEWFNATASMVRHFAEPTDAPLDWKEQALTFNTSCYSCHVSQLSTNYDLQADTYHSVWAEPGINCETCHGPCEEHVRVCSEAPDGPAPADLKLIRATQFTVEQTNDSCAPCHAKMAPLTAAFKPGGRFFDQYDLVTLEDPDFYPDGRDLGENYTYTQWRMSPCAISRQLDCLHCHTSSGRYRFKGENANNACLPCHERNVREAAAHSHHPTYSEGSRCVSCHMPKTEFARMARSDHSMRPPAPTATLAFQSPNACNLCHTERSAAWADQVVRQWRRRDYQKPILYRAGLIEAARKRNWKQLPEMLSYISDVTHDEVTTTSLIRLLRFCDSESKWPALMQAMNDRSPLIRAAAAAGLQSHVTPQAREVLLAALRDDYRLVRLQATMALSTYPADLFTAEQQQELNDAFEEYEASLRIRPDQWTAHYNLGNYYSSRGEMQLAITAFETASRLQPSAIEPLVNASLAYNFLGQNTKAETSLRRALELAPGNAAASLNLGLLLAEEKRFDEAKQALRDALKADPELAVAAYNLGVLLVHDDPEEALYWCKRASELRPEEPNHAYTYALCLNQNGEINEACEVLEATIKRHPSFVEAHLLLSAIYVKQGRHDKALAVSRAALKNEQLAEHERLRIAAAVQALQRP